jgi:hypothetical protein
MDIGGDSRAVMQNGGLLERQPRVDLAEEKPELLKLLAAIAKRPENLALEASAALEVVHAIDHGVNALFADQKDIEGMQVRELLEEAMKARQMGPGLSIGIVTGPRIGFQKGV